MTQVEAPRPVWPAGAVLLLGIGAQKAGTSWVYQYLRRHPGCRPGPMKELHYFDGLEGDGRLGQRLRAQRARALARRGDAAGLAALQRLQAICERPDADHRSYVDLVTAGLAPGQVAMDITPAYATLGEGMFRQMAALGETRFLFLMREPVARLWSALRMRVAKVVSDPARFETACRERLDRMLVAPRAGDFLRADYAATLDVLERCVPAARRLVMFTETLFGQAAADRLCAFLGIAPRPVPARLWPNRGPAAEMRADQVERLVERLRPQYQAVCAAFGAAVPPVWHARFAPAGGNEMDRAMAAQRGIQR